MARNRGSLYQDAEGNKYIAYLKEQHNSFAQKRKALVHHVDDKFQPKLNADGKRLVGLKSMEKLMHIGFVD